MKVDQWVAVFGEQLGDLAVKRGDSRVEVLDVASELSDATRSRA